MRSSNTLANIDSKLEQLREQRNQLVARESHAKRKLRTRQMIIIGAWVLNKHPEWVLPIAKLQERRQDREAFGLPPREEAEPPKPPVTEVDIELPLEATSTMPRTQT